jgi:hypothetical protein
LQFLKSSWLAISDAVREASKARRHIKDNAQPVKPTIPLNDVRGNRELTRETHITTTLIITETVNPTLATNKIFNNIRDKLPPRKVAYKPENKTLPIPHPNHQESNKPTTKITIQPQNRKPSQADPDKNTPLTPTMKGLSTAGEPR